MAYLLTPKGHDAWKSRTQPPNYGRVRMSPESFGWKNQAENEHDVVEGLIQRAHERVVEEVPIDTTTPIVNTSTEIQVVTDPLQIYDNTNPSEVAPHILQPNEKEQAGVAEKSVLGGGDDDADDSTPAFSARRNDDSDSDDGLSDDQGDPADSVAADASMQEAPEATGGIDFVRSMNIETWNADMRRLEETLAFIADCLEYDKRARNRFRGEFDSYIASFETTLLSNLRVIPGSDQYNWDTILTDANYRHIADVALRLRPTPPSEASAERAISMERLIIVALRNRAKNDLVSARVALMGLKPRQKGDNDMFTDPQLYSDDPESERPKGYTYISC